jgi:hypothetical protein
LGVKEQALLITLQSFWWWFWWSFSIIYTFIAQSGLDKSHKFVLIYFYLLFERESQHFKNISSGSELVGRQAAALSDSLSVFLRPLSRIVWVTDVSLNCHAEWIQTESAVDTRTANMLAGTRQGKTSLVAYG